MALRAELGVALDELRPLIGDQVRFATLAALVLDCPDGDLSKVELGVRGLQDELGSILTQRRIVQQAQRTVTEVSEMWRGRLLSTIERPTEMSPEQQQLREMFFGS